MPLLGFEVEGAIEGMRVYLTKAASISSEKAKTKRLESTVVVKPPKGVKPNKDDAPPPPRVQRFKNVFAKPLTVESDYKAPVHSKTESQQEVIKEALLGNFIFVNLDKTSRKQLLKAFEPIQFNKGDTIITQGELGDYMYIIEKGTVQFIVDGNQVGTGDQGVFGELAIMYDSPRAATVICDTKCSLWRVHQTTVRKIKTARVKRNKTRARELVAAVPFLYGLNEETKNLIADSLRLKVFTKDEVWIQKGTPCQFFVIVNEGTLRATDIEVGESHFENLDYTAGNFFGATLIEHGKPWPANVMASTDGSAFYLGKENFIKILGGLNLEDMIIKTMQQKLLAAIPIIVNTELIPLELKLLQELLHVKSFEKGHIFTKKGEIIPEPAIYIVQSGSVSFSNSKWFLTHGNPDKVLKVGEYFGDDELIPPSGSKQKQVVAKHTISAAENVKLGVLTLEAIESIIWDSSRLGKRMAKNVNIDTSITLKSLQKYRILGAGTFGQVWLVSKEADKGSEKSVTPYALKIQYKRDIIGYDQVEGVLNEKNIMEAMDHPFVIRLVNSYKDEQRIYMLMQLLQGGELFDTIHTKKYDGVPEQDALFYASGILEGLSYMHRRQILHRDLKGENVLMDNDGYCVLVDLGFAKVVPDKTYTCCGTPIFMAPEVILGEGHNHGADLWSLGVLIFDMIFGYDPFYKPEEMRNQMDLFRAIIDCKYKFPSHIPASSKAKDLIKSLLTRDLSLRLGCSTRGDLEIRYHPWFKQMDFAKLYRKDLIAPWVPEISDPFDVSHFDDWSELENEKKKRKPLTQKEQHLFDGF